MSEPTAALPYWFSWLSWFSLITGGVTVKPESEASEETLLPTWISGGKCQVPELTESQSVSEVFFFFFFKWWSWYEYYKWRKGKSSHPLPWVYAFMDFFFLNVGSATVVCFLSHPHKNTESRTSVCLAGSSKRVHHWRSWGHAAQAPFQQFKFPKLTIAIGKWQEQDQNICNFSSFNALLYSITGQLFILTSEKLTF